MKLLDQIREDIARVERDIVAFLKWVEQSADLGAMTPIERRYAILGPDTFLKDLENLITEWKGRGETDAAIAQALQNQLKLKEPTWAGSS